jgi:hypothetical protein
MPNPTSITYRTGLLLAAFSLTAMVTTTVQFCQQRP